MTRVEERNAQQRHRYTDKTTVQSDGKQAKEEAHRPNRKKGEGSTM